MDKKYNGFNNGRDKSDGVGGREVNHGTQETMTKEQILEILNNVYRNNMTPGIATGIIQQQLSAERERAGKLVEALRTAVAALDACGMTNTCNSLQQTINDYDTSTKS